MPSSAKQPEPVEISVPPEFRRGDNRDEISATDEAEVLLEYMGDTTGWPGLDGVRILDVGCGVKFTQAILRGRLPVGRYVGVDVFDEMLDHLRRHVDDERFEYVHLDAHNEMYNPEGVPLAEAPPMDIGNGFDVVCGFSLFTHLAPHDYVAMLRLMRRHVADDGRLFISLFVNETTLGGHGLIDAFSANLAKSLPEGPVEPPDFVDLTPSKPLLHAVYSRAHALELIEGTGWDVIELRDPLPKLQHHLICRPI